MSLSEFIYAEGYDSRSAGNTAALVTAGAQRARNGVR